VESDVLRGIENVIGSNLRETITGNELDNILAGRGGNDNINGGAGNDTYDFRGSAVLGTDTFNDESGTDKVLVSSFNDIQSSVRVGNNLVVNLSKIGSFTVVDHFAGHAIENIVAGSQTLVLATGLIGGAAAGIISGTDGNETLDGMGGDDMLFAADGHDQLLGGEGNDKLYAGKGDDLAEGGEGDDLIYGDKGHDQLAGNDGNDELYGDKGNDILEGGRGSDLLSGGEGADVFVFAESSFGPGPNEDVITDFGSNDRIDLSAFDTTFNALLDGDGPVSLSVDGDDTILIFESGTVQVLGVTHLHANDFIL
jgi:Ca2+-binding RTX toxin-like protein